MHASDLWESNALKARLARVALFPLSCLYALGWETYLAVYRMGVKRAKSPHAPILCVGNLVVGGAGKTPVTLRIARLLADGGYEVVIGCSGYGAPHAEAATLAPSGPISAQEWGDEPAMIRWLLPNIPIVVGRRRVLAAELVHGAQPQAILVMDDGFQHLPLRKTFTIVLDPAHPRNRLCLPAGPYREPRWNRRRADALLPDRFSVRNLPLSFVSPDGSAVDVVGAYDVLCALGQPGRFLGALEEQLGRRATVSAALADHDPLDGGTLLEQFSGDYPVVVTAKDWVKLRERLDLAQRNFVIALNEVRIEPEAEFRDWLGNKVHGRST